MNQLIAADETDFLDVEKQHGQYYIGNYCLISETWLLLCAVSPNSFFKYPLPIILKYLHNYSIIAKPKNIGILQLDILSDGTYSVVNKIFWIRWIQRCWKKRYQARKNAIIRRGNFANQFAFFISGKYPEYLPTIHGLLAT